MTLSLPLSQSADVETLIVYEQQRPPYPQPQSAYPRPESRVPGQQGPSFGRPGDQPQAYAWNTNVYDQTGYGVFPNPTAAYTQPRPDPRVNLGRSASYAAGQPRPQVHPSSQQAQQAPQLQPQTAYSQPYLGQDNPGAFYPQARPQQAEAPRQPEQTQTPSQPQTQQQPAQLQSQQQPQHSPQQHQVQSQVPAQTQPQPQVQTQNVVQQQHPGQAQASHSPVEAHASVQPQPQAGAQKQQQQQQTMTTPFVFDPNTTYPDQNVQAWAQYYAQGGTDPTGSVYFISVPGITDAPSSPTTGTAVQPGTVEGQQQREQATLVARSFSVSGPGSAPGTAIPGHIITQGLQRQNSLPNPYGPVSPTKGEMVGSVSARPGPGMAARAPWDVPATPAETTTLPGQFAQMRVGEPSVGA